MRRSRPIEPEEDEEEVIIEAPDFSDEDFALPDQEADEELANLLDDPEEPAEESTDIIVATTTVPTLRARRRDSSREEDNVPLRPGERALDFHKLYSGFVVNWDATEQYPVLGRVPRRAALVGWTPQNLKSVEITSQMYDSIARECPGPEEVETDEDGNETVVKIGCPCAEKYGIDPNVWAGHPCPSELIAIFRHFVNYVRDLRILPEDHVDIQQVVEIIKLHIYESRLDHELQHKEPMYDLQVGTLDQKNGKVYWNKVIAIALEQQERLSKRRQALLRDLKATRRDRHEQQMAEKKANAALGTAVSQMTTAEMMSQLNRVNIENRKNTTIMPTVVMNARDVTPDDDDI